ncbi:MAG: MBL fold metallo-hydrolase [Deltaproteobacteria bacterium]|nr:MBL fold metallo-hydrolase [Deltaproteobacteria bacterium]MBW2394049.1 MBL fold metallo-hydrolase [Deltaproteobacteria bacterium]
MAWENLGIPKWAFTKGLADVGNGIYAYLQPDGSWGWSNAGLVVDGDESLLVDTLFDVPLTGEMLEAMRAAEPGAAARIDKVVNTHANGDHCHGNELVAEAEIIASKAAAEEMDELPPSALAAIVAATKDQDSKLARFIQHAFGSFQFEGITYTPPNRTFEKELSIRVGDKQVELYEVGPAHTRGDVLVHVPADRTVFSGDILFIEGTPIIWAGPVGNWIAACDRILALAPEVIVPGHGPITDARGVEAVKAYLEFIRDEARKRYDAGLTAMEAAKDIELGDFSSWGDAERIAVNVDTLYREFSGEVGSDTGNLLAAMAELADI